jgi:hypothetical protein
MLTVRIQVIDGTGTFTQSDSQPCRLLTSLHGLRSGRDRFVRSLPRYFGQVRLLHHTHHRLRPPAFPTTSRPRLAGTAMEISRFPCKRLLRMPGSTTTRGRHVSRDIDTGRVAFCGTENISTPNLSYAAQYLACTLPCERFTSALADNPCITRGRYGSLLLHRDGLPPSTFCRSPGAPVHTWPEAEVLPRGPTVLGFTISRDIAR